MEECLRKWQANFDTDVGYRKFVISVFLENLIECSHPPVHAFDAINSVQIGSITIALRRGIEITAVELYARYIKIKVVKVRFYFDSSPLFFDGSRALEQGCVDGPAELKYRSKFLKMRG